MKEYIVRCANNKFTIEGEIVRCKDCMHRNWETKGCKRNPSVVGWLDDDSCNYGKKQVTSKLNNLDDFLLREGSKDCKEQKSKLEASDTISRQEVLGYIDRLTGSGLGKMKSLEYIKKYVATMKPIEKLQLSSETSTNGTYIRDGRLMHDLVYRGEAEVNDTDLISRQAAIEAVEKAVFKGVAKSANESLPPVEPKPVCEDAISRADTVNALCRECTIKTKCTKYGGADYHENWCPEVAVVMGMPSVEPMQPKRTETMIVDGEPTEIDPLSYEVGYTHGQMERPKGEWIPNHDGTWTCSYCGLLVFVSAKENVCRNCGADMRGDKE